MRSIGRGVAVLSLCAFALGGCATTGGMDLKTPIDGFATAAKSAQTALQTYDDLLDATTLKADTEDALKGVEIVDATGTDCTLAAARCRIVLKKGNGDERYLSSQPLDPVAREVMAGVVTYATNLQTIAAIDAQADVKAATDATLANIGQLGTDIDAAAAAAHINGTNLNATVAPFIAPVSDAVSAGLGAYLDAKKLAALRSATTAMDAILPKLIALSSAAIVAEAANQKIGLSIAYNDAYLAYQSDKKSAAKLDTLRTASVAFDAALSANPGAALQELVTAHAALTTALKPEEPSFGSAMAAIQRAIAAAQKVQTIIQGFQTAAKPAAT